MPRYWILALGALLAVGALAARRAPLSGVDLQYVDRSVRPQDDLYRHLNGKWLDSFQIPADKGSYGSFTYLYDATQEQLRVIVDGLDGSGDAEARKIADLYASFMDESRLEALGLKPLQAEFAAIDAISDKKEIPALITHLNRIGAGAPYAFSINQDARNSLQYAVIVRQSGLGMPDRDYYLKDDAKLKDTRAKYLVHIGKMLGMAGDADSQSHAAAILDLETALARVQWTRVENRDPIKTYNKTAIAELPQLMPGYAWQEYMRASDIAGRVDSVIINQPSYFSGLDKLMTETPLPDWKAYLKWHVMSAAAP
jgi:predicted metalloendopeptidase